MITVAYVNFWKDPFNDSYFTRFLKHNFGEVRVVHHTKVPDVLIASVNGNIQYVKSVKAKCKLFYYGENLNRYPPYNNDSLLRETFDLIVGFKKTDKAKKQIRFPLWLIYYKYYWWDNEDNILTYIQSRYTENVNKEKKLFATLVARHDRGGQRTIMCDNMQKYGQVWYPGRFRKNTTPIGPTQNHKINYISQSRYNICPENSAYEGYFTEKIFQAFEAGTIPIYWGIDHPETNIINKNKYCFCDVRSKDVVSESIRDVTENPSKYTHGDLFTPQASEEIQMFYTSLKEAIESFITE